MLCVDVIISSKLEAKVIEVNGLPSMQLGQTQSEVVPDIADGITAYTELKFNMTKDVVKVRLLRELQSLDARLRTVPSYFVVCSEPRTACGTRYHGNRAPPHSRAA